jgi:hypothetical protein
MQLLHIPELLAVVRAWDGKIRAEGLEKGDLWFAAIDLPENN